MALFTADCLDRADAGEAEAQGMRRILTPLIKLRVCRDARKVAGDAMEMRGGCGYIEEWIEPRLLRETHLGSIWEGTSNIIALDVVRAAGKTNAHKVLADRLGSMLSRASGEVAEGVRERLAAALALIERAWRPDGDARGARQASAGLYYATAAVLFLHQAERLNDATWADLAKLMLAHKLAPRDPLAGSSAEDDATGDRVIDALVNARVSL
jgi:hypothetical protein